MAGFSDAVDQVRAIADRLANMTPIMRIVAIDVKALVDRSFQTGAAPDGTAWAPHSQTTIDRRRVGRGSGAARLLLDTGRLRRSITAVASRTGVVFGTNLVYAPAQQFGNPSNKMFGKAPAPIPARPFLPISRDGLSFKPASEMQRIQDMVRRWLETGEA